MAKIPDCKFDYGNFSDGRDKEFVAHAKKFTKEEAIELCIQENDHKFDEKYCNGQLHRKPTAEDVKERAVRYYPVIPDHCGYDGTRGCYSYCSKWQRGSFSVWVIEFEQLQIAGGK